jgi:3D (Asp-Asp-Asp) domain-containing protein/septal ring factor EnvC (AmiA/AmiB activator)
LRALLWYGAATVSGRRTRSAARLAGISAALAAVAVSAAAANPGAPYRHRAATLRVRAQALDTRAHRALLGLYALDTRLGRAQATLTALEAESQRLQAQLKVLAQQLSAAHGSLLVSQQLLGRHLRDLYERGDVDALAIVLGAQSIDDALTRLDDLSHVADQNRQVVAATTTAQARLTRLRTRLTTQRAQVDAALARARDAALALTAARAARVSYIGGLRRQQRLAVAQIGALEATAQRVSVKSQAIQQTADPPADGVATTGSASTAPTPAEAGRTITVSATGYSLPGHTATGLPVGWGVVAVDPSVIPLGTRLTVPGYGEAVAADVGTGVHGAMIDLWFPSLAQAHAWGRRMVTITLH